VQDQGSLSNQAWWWQSLVAAGSDGGAWPELGGRVVKPGHIWCCLQTGATSSASSNPYLTLLPPGSRRGPCASTGAAELGRRVSQRCWAVLAFSRCKVLLNSEAWRRRL
jgi:hypothetical protein